MSAMVAIFLAFAATNAPEAAKAAPGPTVESPPPAVTDSASPQSAMTHDGAHGIRAGVKLGAVIPTSKLGTAFGFGIDGEYRLPVLARQIGVGVEFGYAAPSLDGTGQDPTIGSYAYGLKTRIMSFAFEAIGRRAFGNIEPYAAIGYALVGLKARTSAFGVETTETQLRGGLQLRGGAGYKIGPGDVFAEARYQYAQLRFESTGDASGGTFALAAGYRFTF